MKSPLKIIIFQTAEPLIIDNDNARPMRAMNLANALIERGHFITLISTDFYHQKKIHRFNRDSKFIVSRNFNLILIKSIGYVHHIGLQRIFDHIQLAYKLNKYFKDEKPNPDVAVIGYPPIEPAWVLSKLLKNRKVITLLDVKDLWPIMFSDKVPALLKPIFNILILNCVIISHS